MKRLVALTLLIFAPNLAPAQDPLSAIDWLSESLKTPPQSFEFRIDPAPLIDPISPEIEESIATGTTSPDAIGILSPEITGFSPVFWGNLPAATVVEALHSFPDQAVPEAKNLFLQILLAQTNPTFDTSGQGEILKARIIRLFEMGALDEAEALLALAHPMPANLFDSAFEVAIMTNRTTQICNALKAAPALSSDLSTRVYCLARGGDWNAAAITLSLGGSIGAIDPAREEMLVRYLDPELFDGEPDPEIPDPLNTMDFVLREAVFLPRPNGLLPLPYLYRDTGVRAPLRARIETSERLVKAQVMPSNLLFAAYRTGKAAASGGVWGRKSAVQALDVALEKGGSAQISTAAITASTALGEVGLLIALAEEYGETLAALPYAPEYDPAVNQILTLIHLAGISASTWETHASPDAHQTLAQLLVSRAPLTLDPASDALVQAITRAFTDIPPDTASARRLFEILDNGNQGEAILAALTLISAGAESDPESIRTALYILSSAGQSAAARRIAVQILLLPE